MIEQDTYPSPSAVAPDLEQGVYRVQDTVSPKDRSPRGEIAHDAHEVSLLDVLTQLVNRKRLIAKVTGVALLAGVAVCVVLPVRYTAITKIMPPQQTQSTSSMLMNQLVTSGVGSLAAMAATGGLSMKNPNDIYIGLLTSRTVADAVIKKFTLTRAYHSKDMTAARKTLARNTVVESEKTGFISISVTDKDKRRVADMANTYTEELRKLTKSLAVTEASQRRLFYEQQMKGAQDALVVAEVEFKRVQQVRGVVAPEAQAKAIIEGIAVLRAMISTKEVDLQALRSYSTERNPGVELAERELSSTKTELAHLEQRGNFSEDHDLGLGDVPSASLDYLEAEHELKYRQAVFDLLIKQFEAAKLDEAKEAAIIQVVEPAIEPDRRSSPQRTAIIIGSIMAGISVGCLSVLLRHTQKSSVLE